MKYEQIENNFTRHAPEEKQVTDMAGLRGLFKSIAFAINRFVPESREQSLAITSLEQSMMWANAGIVRNPPAPADGEPQTPAVEWTKDAKPAPAGMTNKNTGLG